jgi:cytoskeleton protein RodZ
MNTAMPTVAEQLRRAREAQNLSIHQLAEVTKIKTDHLRALEAGDYDVFTAPVYIRGFVRITASVLKLNVPQVISVLDVELAATEKFAAPPSLAGPSGGLLDILMYQLSKIKWQVVLPLVGILLAAWLGYWGFRTWKIHRTQDPLSNLGPGLYQPPSSTRSGDTLPLPKTPPPRKP